jgi:hypothetical protein
MSLEQVADAASVFTYPIFQFDRNDRPELIGSSVAVEFDDKYFLCTAKHVIERLDRSRPTYCPNSNLSKKGTFIELNGIYRYSEDADGIEFDLSLIDVSMNKDNFSFLNKSIISLGSKFRQTSYNVLLGYPLSKNKPTKSIDSTRKEATSKFQPVGVKLDSNIAFSQFRGIKKSVHIGFRYNLDYKKQLLPFPRGMSGCGVWNVPSVYKPNEFYLAGIFIEYHRKEKVGFATKSKYIIKLSEQFV